MTSIIIPIYNAERWLSDLLQSISAQTIDDWEAILVNDGSTDSSEEICNTFAAKDSRFKLFTIENAGVSCARNFGLTRAQGEEIFFADADDMIHPKALEILRKCAAENCCDIVIGGISYGKRISFTKLRGEKTQIMTPHDAIEMSLYQRPPLNYIWGVLYNRAVFDGISFVENIRYEDLEIHHRLFARARRIAYLPEKLYFYRKHNESFINTFSPSRLDALTVTDKIEEHYKATNLEAAAADRRFAAHFNVLLLLLSTDSSDICSVNHCVNIIKTHRQQVLTDKKSRAKNRLGALLSYLGVPFLRILSKVYFK